MEKELTPIEAASYCAYSFSYNMYNDMLLFTTLNIISTMNNSGIIGLNESVEDDMTEQLCRQVLTNSEYRTIGIA